MPWLARPESCQIWLFIGDTWGVLYHLNKGRQMHWSLETRRNAKPETKGPNYGRETLLEEPPREISACFWLQRLILSLFSLREDNILQNTHVKLLSLYGIHLTCVCWWQLLEILVECGCLIHKSKLTPLKSCKRHWLSSISQSEFYRAANQKSKFSISCLTCSLTSINVNKNHLKAL